jgi:hypothetical protein
MKTTFYYARDILIDRVQPGYIFQQTQITKVLKPVSV